MLKAVVFDDEFIVLRGLKKLINWSEYGVELIATATDGIAALKVFREVQPDIIMTDIRMPGMDGLQLIEIIRKEAPNTMCIVFSGYNEFDYVKRAIKLDVVDYLEKPISIAKIREGIEKAVERIKTLHEISSLKQKWQQGMLEKATMDLLLKGEEAEEAWLETFGDDALRITGVTVLACSEDGLTFDTRGKYHYVQLRNGYEYLHVLFHFNLYTEDWMEELITWTDGEIGSGKTYFKLSDIQKSYKEALRALRYGKYLEEKGWTRFEDLGKNEAIPPTFSEREEEVLFDLRVGNKDGLLVKLDNFIQAFKSEKLDPEVAENEILRLVYLGMQVAKETGGDLTELRPIGYLPQRELRGQQTQAEMAGWLQEQMEMIIDWIIRVRQRSKHSAVEKAVHYIEQNYGRDLSQQEVADDVQMNAAYFSLLFKEQMGISYIKYLTKVRMEKAKQMLSEGLTIQEVSQQVGYYHARHFSEVFKKHYGVTPGQYRSLNDKRSYLNKAD